MNKLEALNQAIINSGEYHALKSIEAKLNDDYIALDLIKQIKKYQKQSLIKPSIETEKKLNQAILKLHNHPIYVEYLNAVDDYNNLIKQVNSKINNYVNQLIDLNL